MIITLPETHYARTGDGVRIAYQIHGDGPVALVAAFGPASHLDVVCEGADAARFLDRMGSFARVIRFDRRGTGLSDPASAPPTVEQYSEDLDAVLRAAALERPMLYGEGEAGRMFIHYAATHPERIAGLALFGSSASGASVITPERREMILDVLEEHWGEGACCRSTGRVRPRTKPSAAGGRASSARQPPTRRRAPCSRSPPAPT